MVSIKHQESKKKNVAYTLFVIAKLCIFSLRTFKKVPIYKVTGLDSLPINHENHFPAFKTGLPAPNLFQPFVYAAGLYFNNRAGKFYPIFGWLESTHPLFNPDQKLAAKRKSKIRDNSGPARGPGRRNSGLETVSGF